ncbi:MAG: winged helix-turn-helix transcriptional regulator, partial [Chloroflexi bacterium]
MVLARDVFTPRYREIEQSIRQRLARLKPGAELPSDARLCEEFGVSRMTARHAMNRLAEEGLVFR